MPDDANPRAVIGANNPPDPFAAIDAHVSDLMDEARNWCDGAAIENDAQADAVAKLIDDFRAAQKAADDARKEEARPFDEAKAAIQAKYAPLLAETKAQTGAIPRALAALKATLTPWLQAKERARQEAERIAREEAQRKADEAANAARQAAASDLAAQEAAEAAVKAAQDAQADADRIARERSNAKGDGRAIGLRRSYRAVMTNRQAALKHYAANRPDDLIALLQKLADADVREGKRQIPGFEIIEEAKV
jgi:hypothetical protein